MSHVLIIGGGFAGLNAAKGLGGVRGVEVTLVDRSNHHLFQPLLYQVAMAGLSPADIAAPIRSMLSRYRNIRVLQGEVRSLDLNRKLSVADFGEVGFDYLILACGVRHSYFGHDEWEEHAPGLKNLEQATEIRRRVLSAYEQAERSKSLDDRKRFLTFVIVGGGPTGVELAGAIGEMSRFTLAKDFRNIDSTQARVILLEAGSRILPLFSEQHATAITERQSSWTTLPIEKVRPRAGDSIWPCPKSGPARLGRRSWRFMAGAGLKVAGRVFRTPRSDGRDT